jgi:predicted nucleotidyltransferase
MSEAATPTLIYETVHGSRAYGLERPDSDLDLKGVIVGPASWYHGFLGGEEQLELSADHVWFELRKFVRLAAAANPTVLELLFTEPSDHRTLTPAGRRLLAARDEFLSLKVAETFNGYALGQLKRIQTHRRWLLEPPRKQPARVDFGLPETAALRRDQLGAAEALLGDEPEARAGADTNFIELLAREKRYRQARAEWSQYQTWLAQRNRARAALEAEHGYDTKHAMHLVRLQRMALEILETGQVHVRRADRAELLAIRAGAWTYDALLAASEAMTLRVNALRDSSSLPAEPDYARLDRLCASIVEEVLHA